jgi:hypothetical protein
MSSKRLRIHVPAITANYLAILALIYAALALQVIRLRRNSSAPFNDSGNEGLRSAIRAHGNFIGIRPHHRADGRASRNVRRIAPAHSPVDGCARVVAAGASARHVCDAGSLKFLIAAVAASS